MDIKLLAVVMVMLIWISLSLVVHAQQSIPELTYEVNSKVGDALQGCGITEGVFITSKFITYTNNSITITMGLSNNYQLIMTLNLSAGQMPIDSINITVETPTGHICSSNEVRIPQISGYAYYVVKTNYSLIVVSYKDTQTPLVTGTARSVTIYDITPATVISIPLSYGYVICNTGVLSPVYMVMVLHQPIIYITQGKPSGKGSVLCAYHQGYFQYFFMMAIIIGLAIAVIYESIMLFITMRQVTTLQ